MGVVSRAVAVFLGGVAAPCLEKHVSVRRGDSVGRADAVNDVADADGVGAVKGSGISVLGRRVPAARRRCLQSVLGGYV